jgi:hypothetical protein
LLFIFMDHNMVFSYDYGKQKKGRQKTNAPPSGAISMAMVGAIQMASPNAACPGLPQKSMDAAIG